MPKISVIIPVYNGQEYLAACLDSVCSQSERDIELICVNDGSTDSSLSVLNEYAEKDARVKVFTIPNGGVSGARNFGLDRASGKYIIFCDCDDTVMPDAFKKLSVKAERGAYDIVIGGTMTINDSGHIIKPLRSAFFGSFYFAAAIWDRIYLRSFIEENSLRFEPFSRGEDAVFSLCSYLCHPKYLVIPDLVYCYWHHNLSSGASLTHSYCPSIISQSLTGLERMLELCRLPELQAQRALIHRSWLSDALSSLLLIRDVGEYEAAFACFQDFFRRIGWDEPPELFLSIFSVSYEDFMQMSPFEYLLCIGQSPLRLPPKDFVLSQFRNGELGFRYIASYIKAWFSFKLELWKKK